MGTGIGIVDVSGGAIIPVSSSIEASGSINLRRQRDRDVYGRLIQGRAYRREVGEAPQTAIASFSPPFVVSSSVFSYNDQLATPPSWTQRHVGLGHDNVISALSSSNHESSRLNAYRSGTLALETSAVPASGAAYYSKSSRFVRRIYKLSASADLPVNPITPERYPATNEIPTPRGLYDATSGSYRSYSYFNPAVFQIEVPDYGRIREVKVWLEFVHDVRFTGSANEIVSFGTVNGLGGLQVALRSPNVTFTSAHPLWNDPQLKGKLHRNTDTTIATYGPLTGSAQQFGNQYYQIPELLQSSYLLWEGPKPFFYDDLLPFTLLETELYASWQADMDMRTVFTDSTPQYNPRNLENLYTGSDSDTSAWDWTALLPYHSASSPNFTAFSISPSASFLVDPRQYGKNVPWFLDPRIPSGSNIRSRSDIIASGVAAGFFTADAPPPGWLTGPGGTAAAGEFPTQGPNLGPPAIQPAYPLLDDVHAVMYGADGSILYRGSRPGLRGTEVHGTWRLLIGTMHDFDPVQGMVAVSSSGIWFRQFRLEFILDQGVPDQSFYPSAMQRYSVPGNAMSPGSHEGHIYAASTDWEPIWTRRSYSIVGPEYGRTVGITDNTGSDPNSIAVFTRLTGTLADALSGTSVPYFYLHNEFGTPFIPLSSGSGIPPSFNLFSPDEALASRTLASEIVDPNTTINPANTIRDHLSRAEYYQTTRERILQEIGVRAGLAAFNVRNVVEQ